MSICRRAWRLMFVTLLSSFQHLPKMCACFKKLKGDLAYVESLFHSTHDRFRINKASVDEISCTFFTASGAKVVMTAGLMVYLKLILLVKWPYNFLCDRKTIRKIRQFGSVNLAKMPSWPKRCHFWPKLKASMKIRLKIHLKNIFEHLWVTFS